MVADHQTKTNIHFAIVSAECFTNSCSTQWKLSMAQWKEMKEPHYFGNNSLFFVFWSPFHSERKLTPLFDTHLHNALFVWKDINFSKVFCHNWKCRNHSSRSATLEQTGITSSNRGKKGERQNKNKSSTILLIKPLKSVRKNILDYYRLREQRCILKMIPL